MLKLISILVFISLLLFMFYKMYRNILKDIEDFDREVDEVRDKWLKIIERMEKKIMSFKTVCEYFTKEHYFKLKQLDNM